jgi:hypothetical protein
MSEGHQDQGETSLVAALVGEGKKYANLEELAKSRIEADNFIDTLKAENAELRSSANQQNTIKDVMDAIKSQNKSEGADATPLDDDVLQQKINDLLETREAERTRKANRSEAEKLEQSKTDRDPKDWISEKAKQLGMNADTLWKLSEESPTGFANLVGLGSQKPVSSGNPGALPHVNADALRPSASMEIEGHKTKAWYDQQRAQMGAKKFINDRQMQLGMLRSREALGDKFYN